MAAEEEGLGKAYDGRIIRRLMRYLSPYRLQVALALVAIVLKAGADVLGPYLVKVAVDTYMSDATPEKLDRLLDSLRKIS